MTGHLYIVGSPIGNLEDITLRAIRVLKEAALILAEDTRQTRKLLSHLAIATPCERYDDRFHDSRKRAILERCQRGENIALLSDAGTPVISDPGWSLVKFAWEMNIRVVPIPGPSAPITALSVCGFPLSHFVFWGFLPRAPNKIRRALSSVNDWECVVFFESPHRLMKTLKLLDDLKIDSLQVCIARELTKFFEEIVRGPLAEVMAHFEKGEVKGELCVIVYKPN